jgi:hypothetical protein
VTAKFAHDIESFTVFPNGRNRNLDLLIQPGAFAYILCFGPSLHRAQEFIRRNALQNSPTFKAMLSPLVRRWQ